MHKVCILIASLTLGACAQLRTLENVYTYVSTATVQPQAIVVAANAFDALEGTATQYLLYCKRNLATSPCSANNRRIVIRAVRSGRAARNQLETYLQQSVPAPAQVYNVLVAAINQLNASAVTAVKGAQ